jgi:hypothetical protein
MRDRHRERPSFIHDNERDFRALLRLASERHRAVDPLYVEKDYWVTHTLDALQRAGFEVHFKGGTSLSKGFRLIERFSEDLDLKIDAPWLPDISDTVWKSSESRSIPRRRQFFDQLLQTELARPLTWSELPEFNDDKLRNIGIRVDYPLSSDAVDPLMRRYVLLEVGRARVTPAVEQPVSSWVHDELERAGEEVHRPVVRCVHPLVTLYEKCSALQSRASRDDVEPSRYVRHYEDAVHIIRAWEAGRLPPVDGFDSPRALAAELLRTKDIKPLDPDHPAFTLASAERAARQRQALDALAPYFWGPRVPLDDATAEIRTWLTNNL